MSEIEATYFRRYLDDLRSIVSAAQFTKVSGEQVAAQSALELLSDRVRATHVGGGRLMFIGNGGSAGICSHMATDYSKNGGLRSTAFNDASVLTCISNDYDYSEVFAKQIEWHGRGEDLLIAISSSGRSPNIMKGVAAAKARGAGVVTLSGFKPDNPLREMGELNVYLASESYGFVEIGHLTVLHAVLDYTIAHDT